MADSKQHGGLNGAYYGPPVPPPRHTSRSIGSGSDCCCGPCCLLCTLFKFLLSIVIVLGVIALVLWLVFRPNELKVYVEDASLARFDLGPNNTLSYDLSLTLSIRNPNRRIALYYDSVEAQAVYDGYRIGYDSSLPTFFQDHKNTTVIRPAFEGRQPLFVGTATETFGREKGEGWYYVEVKVYTRVRFKVWFIKTNKYTPDFDCKLKLPVPTRNGTAGAGFSRTKCDVDLF